MDAKWDHLEKKEKEISVVKHIKFVLEKVNKRDAKTLETTVNLLDQLIQLHTQWNAHGNTILKDVMVMLKEKNVVE